MARQFLIIHGLGGSGSSHWQSWLADKLREVGEKVCYPDLPTPSTPQLEEWLTALRKAVDQFDTSDELIVLSHSLGPVCWMHFEKRYPEIIAKKVFLVAPVVVYPDVEEVASFFPVTDFTPHPETEYTVVASENDPWITFENTKKFVDEYNLNFVFLEGKGHINVDAGFGPWPWILEECLTA